MKLTKHEWLLAGKWMGLFFLGLALGCRAEAQAVSTTTVQGTVYEANGQPGAGTVNVSWPAFTTANNQAVAAGRMSVTIAPDGFVSLNLAPNLGATPAGLYYTAIYNLSDGTTSTEYWVVPAAAQASLGQVRAQVMPAAQAVQAVSKGYVDQAITALKGSTVTVSGGTMSGPLLLSGDPAQPLQAADKHYVDSTFSLAVPLAGGRMTGPLATPTVNGVQAPVSGSPQTTVQAAINAAETNGAVEIPPNYAGTDSFSNANGVYVRDLRQKSSQQLERSVKEFGAVCDGTTDDTSALQTALNYAQAHGVALTMPQGNCKTRTLTWHGESMGGMGKQVSALTGYPGQDVLATAADSANMPANTRLHDLTINVDVSLDVSCTPAQGRAAAGSCGVNRPMEPNSVFSPGGNGLHGTQGTGAGWSIGNCGIAMPAATGSGGNGLRVAEIENVEIAATGTDPLSQYAGSRSSHTCGMYLAQWPQWSEFRNIDIRGVNTGIAMPALAGTTPPGLSADSNRWQNVTIQAAHAFTAAAGSNNVLDNVVAAVGNSAATGEPPTGLVLDLGSGQEGWTVRNAVVTPTWSAVQPQLAVTASGGAVTAVTLGAEHGLGLDPYGTQVGVKFSGSCTAQALASVNGNGTIGGITVTQGGTGCSGTTTASLDVAGTWDTAAAVNLIAGQSMMLLGGNLLNGNGGYTVWNATGSELHGTQGAGGGGSLPGGGTYTGLVANGTLGSSLQVDQFPGVDFGAKLQACVNALSASYGGTCDARNFTGTLSMGSSLTIATANATVLMPCATIATPNQVIVTAGTRNVTLRGCTLRGASTASGSQGGTVLLYSGAGAAIQVGDPTYTSETMGFHLDNAAINTTPATNSTAQGVAAFRTQELRLESLYFLGNANQRGLTLDGTGNYTGGTFLDDQFTGFKTAVSGVGHQVANPATTDWLNASTFLRLHINCPTSNGSPISGTYGIDLAQGDGNTITGGDVEGCDTALHLGANAQNNTIVGLRNENSNKQVVADAGSAYNSWVTGGTMFTGALTDNGTRNSFLDSFHRAFNGMKGDWYGSQQDATVTNHYRIGIGAGNERGLLDRYQTDYGYRWTMGLSDATAGEQYYQILDELNNVNRLSIGQYNSGQGSTNSQTVVNSAGTGAVVLNGSNNSGTGGVVFGSGGPNETTVATVSSAGNAQFTGTLQVGGTSTLTGSATVKNQADAEIDSVLWAGATASQKESFIYKDWNGNSQWYMVKDASNNWALNSAPGGLDSFKAYQSTNSGDTYINASNSSGAVRINYESGSGAGFNVYGGSSSALYASFTGTTAIKFPGLAASSGHSCLQIDNSGFITNTGASCGTGNTNGTVNVGTTGQIAYYTGNGAAIGGTSSVPVTAGGTGATTASGGLASLGGLSQTQTTAQTMGGALNLPTLEGTLFADQRQSPAGTGNNGIAMSIQQCASQTYACMIEAPSLYALTEAQPFGGAPNGAVPYLNGPKSTQATAGFLDLRYGVPQWIFNQSQPLNSRLFAIPTVAMNSTAGPTGVGGMLPYTLQLINNAYSGGRNAYNSANGYGDKINAANLFMRSYRYTQAQGGGDTNQTVICLGNGDCVGHSMDTIAYGGPNTFADEGNESMRYEAIEGGQVFSGTIGSITTASDLSATITSTSQSFNGYQGEGRLLIDMSKGFSSGTSSYAASIASSSGDTVVVCGGACSWDSTYGTSYQTTLSAGAGNGASSANTFPQSNTTLNVASSTGFASGNIACIFDYDYECEEITGVPDSTHLTIATMRLPHLAGANVTTGGLAGYAFELEADRVVPGNTNGVSTMPDSGLVSTVRDAIPVMYSSPGNALTLFYGAPNLPGHGASYTGRAYRSMGGSGGAVTLTIAGGAVTGCTATGGSGYISNQNPPQLVISGITYSTAPVVYISGISGGALTGCKWSNAGAGISGSPSVAIVPTNSYDIYPSTKVTGVYNAVIGKVDGTLYTEPLVGSFAAGDTVEEPHYFAQGASGMRNVVGSYIPSQAYGGRNGLSYSLNGIWQGNDTAETLANTADPTLFQGYAGAIPWTVGRGQMVAPYGLSLKGAFGWGYGMDTPPLGAVNGSNGALSVGCGTLGCAAWTSPYWVVQAKGWNGISNAYDGLTYNPSTRAWALSGGSLSLNLSGGNVPVVAGTPTAGHLALWGGGSPQTLTDGGAPSGKGAAVMTGPTASVANDAACFGDEFGTLTDCGSAPASGTVTGFAAVGWPSWLVPSVGSATSIPTLSVASSPIPMSALASVAGGGAGLATGPTAGTTANDAVCFADTNGTLRDCGTALSSGTVTSFTAFAGNWPAWMTPSVANGGTTPTLSVAVNSIPNAALANSGTTVNGQSCTLGGSCTVAAAASTLTGAALAAGVTGSSLTSLGTVASGTWQATPIANSYLANSGTTVNGQSCTLGGSCTVAAAASTLTGAALAAGVTGSSLTSVGTVTTGVWHGTSVAAGYGGTGSSAVPGSGQVPVGNSGGTAYSPQTVSGDGTLSSAGALTVTKTNGSAFGTAATVNTGTSGATVPLLNGSNSWSANTTTFANGSAAADYLVVQAGSGADQIGAVEFANYAGASQWEVRKDASNALRIRDAANGADRIIGFQAGQLGLNSAGANAVVVNNTSGSGTGGFIVYNGGSTAELTVTSSGNTTANGFLSGKFYIGNAAMTAATGAAAGSSPTIACATSCTGAQGTYSITTGTGTTTGTLATLTFPSTHANTADCVGNLYLPGTGQVSNWEPVAGTASLGLKVDTTALAASTTYKFTYWCGGN